MTYIFIGESCSDLPVARRCRVTKMSTPAFYPWRACPVSDRDRDDAESNGLLRQYFPKSTDLELVSDQRLQDVADELNDRPRARLGDRTSNQFMAQCSRHQVAS
jgi:hypothetical protein